MRYMYLILGVLIAVVGGGIIENKDRSMRVREIPRRLEINRIQLAVIADGLRDYRRQEGAFPSNDQGLRVLGNSESFLKIRDMAADRDYAPRIRISGGVPYTIWGEPFIYENRRGLPVSRFEGSGADADVHRAYSIKVDKDVYVWSLGAAQEYETLPSRERRLIAVEIALLLVVLILITIYIVLTVRSVGRMFHGIIRVGRTAWSLLGGASIVVAIVVALFPIFVKTCYASVINRPPSDDLRKDYTTLITKYHDQGVISNAAYRRLLNAVKKDSPLQ